MAAEPKAEIHHTYWYEEITLEESLPLWTLLYSCYSCQSDFPVSGPKLSCYYDITDMYLNLNKALL